jgi:hypothetical protein
MEDQERQSDLPGEFYRSATQLDRLGSLRLPAEPGVERQLDFRERELRVSRIRQCRTTVVTNNGQKGKRGEDPK